MTVMRLLKKFTLSLRSFSFHTALPRSVTTEIGSTIEALGTPESCEGEGKEMVRREKSMLRAQEFTHSYVRIEANAEVHS